MSTRVEAESCPAPGEVTHTSWSDSGDAGIVLCRSLDGRRKEWRKGQAPEPRRKSDEPGFSPKCRGTPLEALDRRVTSSQKFKSPLMQKDLG